MVMLSLVGFAFLFGPWFMASPLSFCHRWYRVGINHYPLVFAVRPLIVFLC